jgi:hypothetical protein
VVVVEFAMALSMNKEMKQNELAQLLRRRSMPLQLMLSSFSIWEGEKPAGQRRQSRSTCAYFQKNGPARRGREIVKKYSAMIDGACGTPPQPND